ncbi:MAG: recombinase zinc beta ribbon domain-containing protein [Solirubrobacteraceae bacterium]|nr:recombinase zinc beta ribbon domain-containing protein [Solirubrobacteraceae bacterium]
MLRNDYYLGLVTVEGKTYPGRHEPLIDEETFQIVQQLLASRRQNGARAWKHHHYLAGSLFCGECGGRLLYSRNRSGNGAVHEYFVCINKQWGECRQPYHRLDHLEAKIDRHYATIQLAAADRDMIRRTVTSKLEEISGANSDEVTSAEQTLRGLKQQEAKLFDAFLNDSISSDLHDEHQQRIRRERVAAETITKRLSADFDTARSNLELALTLTGNVQHAYRQAGETLRSLLNRSIFIAIYVDQEPEVVDRELREPFDELIALAEDEQSRKAASADLAAVLDPDGTAWKPASSRFSPCAGRQRRGLTGAKTQKNPRQLSADGGSKVEVMVPPGRIELPLPA